jgi:hypothetical protein
VAVPQPSRRSEGVDAKGFFGTIRLGIAASQMDIRHPPVRGTKMVE